MNYKALSRMPPADHCSCYIETNRHVFHKVVCSDMSVHRQTCSSMCKYILVQALCRSLIKALFPVFSKYKETCERPQHFYESLKGKSQGRQA